MNTWERQSANHLVGSMTTSELSEFVTGNPDPLIDILYYADLNLLPKMVAAAILVIQNSEELIKEELISTLTKTIYIRFENKNMIQQIAIKLLEDCIEQIIGIFKQ